MEETKKENKVLDFFIKTLNGMAYGLFATLIIGTIFGTIGSLFLNGDNDFCQFMANILCDGIGSHPKGIAYVLQGLTGAGIGVGIALALKFDPLKTIVLAAVGEIAAYFSLGIAFVSKGEYSDTFKAGDPLTIYLVCICVALLMQLVLRKKTPVDILIVPLFGCAVGLALSLLIRFPAIYVTYGMQWIIDQGTTFVPFLMGIVVAVLMGMALTAPISSAAIAAMIFPMTAAAGSGLAIASGAAIVGCSAQMVGFAIQSRKDNNIGMVISIGVGTSMLQFKNILKKPIIWLPTIIASAILGPISTCLLQVVCLGSSAGMGTAGLVGQIGTFASMGNTWQTWVGIFVLEIIAPAALVFGLDLLFRKLGWIKEGDLKI
ncbi:MAG: PTS sugar transporter subunit IIC [Bacilli bacterium]|nr:PTS sugar transporter subunit IIC [Bacilli bacterium]